MKVKINIENVLKMFEKPSSSEAIKSAVKEIMPKEKKEKRMCIVLTLISACLSIFIGCQEDTITIIREIVSDLNAVILTVFGVVFTGYTLFQALIDDKVLERMAGMEKDDKTYLQISNDYFLNVMLLDIVAIAINIIVLIILKILPDDFCLFRTNFYNESLATILILFYLTFQIRVLVEIKSFIFNIYQLFNIAAAERILNILEEKETDKTK